MKRGSDKPGNRLNITRQNLPLLAGLLVSALLLVGVVAVNLSVDKPVPVPPASPTPIPQSTRIGTDADVELIRQAADELRNLTCYHYKISGGSTNIEGDVVHSEGASMIGRYGKTPVAILMRGGQFYQQEGNTWVARPVTVALAPLMPELVTTSTVQMAIVQLQDPIDAHPYTPYSFYSFPPLRLHDYQSPHNVYIIGEETMHGTRVTHYEFPSCALCFGNAIPDYYMSSTWIDPVTKYIYRYDVRPNGGSVVSITISRHNDPTLELPTP